MSTVGAIGKSPSQQRAMSSEVLGESEVRRGFLTAQGSASLANPLVVHASAVFGKGLRCVVSIWMSLFLNPFHLPLGCETHPFIDIATLLTAACSAAWCSRKLPCRPLLGLPNLTHLSRSLAPSLPGTALNASYTLGNGSCRLWALIIQGLACTSTVGSLMLPGVGTATPHH